MGNKRPQNVNKSDTMHTSNATTVLVTLKQYNNSNKNGFICNEHWTVNAHNTFNGLVSDHLGEPVAERYNKSGFYKQETVSGSGISWVMCKSAPRFRQTTTPAPHHSRFLQAGCPSSQQRQSTEGTYKWFDLHEQLMKCDNVQRRNT